MKTLRFLPGAARLFYFLFLVLVVVSCKKEEESPQPVDNNPIVGNWQFVSVAPETPGTTIPALTLIPSLAPCINSLVFKFESNNKVSTSGCDPAIAVMTAAGFTIGPDTQWKIENNKLKLTNSQTVKEFPFAQTATETKITVNTNSDPTTAAVNAVIVLKKV
jgi:hypothetical protein